MRKSNDNMMYSLAEHKEKIITDLQNFLNYKRANSIDYGTRLLEPFTVVNFKGTDDSLFVEFEKYELTPHSNHYWVSKKELEQFLLGNKSIGVKLFVDNLYSDNNCLVMDVNLLKNGFKKMTIFDAQKLKGIQINYDGKLYKSYDVQVRLLDDTNVDKIVRLFVFEPLSAESYINKNSVVQNNKVQLKNGITFEDIDSKEPFVKKSDALEAVRMERKSVTDELRSWFMLNMAERVDGSFSDAFLRKLKEIV